MSNMIRNSLLGIILATIVLHSCSLVKSNGGSGTEGRQKQQTTGSGEDKSELNRQAQIDVEPTTGETSKVVAQNDIVVNGNPACALTVRYAGSLDQPVTWRGEKCSEVRVQFVDIKDIENIGQAGKLSHEVIDDLSHLPFGRMLYIEGQFSSSVFPVDASGIIYQFPLAD